MVEAIRPEGRWDHHQRREEILEALDPERESLESPESLLEARHPRSAAAARCPEAA
jgi:hypothetical protein